MEELLKILETNPTLTPRQIGAMLGMDEEEVAREIAELTASGVIKGYRAIIDWDKVSQNHVRALIELKVATKKDRGFDEIGRALCRLL